MKALIGEITLGWHRATRGPLMASLLLLATLCLVILPGFNDTSLIYTGYGLGLYWAILLFTSLWCGGTAYALDRERHRLALTFTKPIHRLTLWWGRWLAVWLPFALAGLVACIILAFRALPEGRFSCSPELPDLATASKVELARLRSLNRVPEGIPEARLLKSVAEDLETRYTELFPQKPRTYLFQLPETLPPDGVVSLRINGSPFLGAKDALKLSVMVPTPTGPITLSPTHLLDAGMTLDLPREAIQPGMRLPVTLQRLDRTSAASVIYQEYHNLHLLLPGRSPLTNLACFGLILLVTTALTAALGVALGCMFSLPVTLFTGVLALLACAISVLSPSVSAIDSVSSTWAHFSTIVSELLANPFATLKQLNPLHALLTGEAIAFKTIMKFLISVVTPTLVICSLFSLCSAVRDEDR